MTCPNPPEFILGKIHTWSRAVLSKCSRDALSGDMWLDALRSLGNELETLGRTTESEFLSLGEKLQNYYQRAEEMSKISTSVAGLMAGKETETVINGFHEVVDRIKVLQGESKRSAITLQRLLDTLSHLNDHLSGFHKTVRSLGVLCVSTRVESARLGNKDIGFNVLANEVGKLALEIEEKYSHLLERTESLSHLIGQTLVRVTDLEKRQRAQTDLILDKTLSSLGALTQTNALSSSGVTNIASRYDAISHSIGEIVSSMQFHDITRQRIEHAKEALDSLAIYAKTAKNRTEIETDKENKEKTGYGRIKGLRFIFSGNGKDELELDPKDQLRLAGDICELQIVQLSNAKDVLVSAVNSIVENLRGVASLVAEMAEETRKMAGAADESGCSFLAEVETGFSSVTAAFSTYAEADHEMSSVMGSLGETLKDMSTFADAIEGIGERIKLIALNAIVKASHIGDEGVTLAVLAESIHQLSIETRQRTETVSGTLRSMTSDSASLDVSENDIEGTNRIGLAGAQQAIGTLLTNLQNINQDIVTLLARMNDEGSALSKDILETLAEVTVHHRVDAAISSAVAQLEEIATSSRSLSSTDDQSDRAKRIEALEASYTMQDEREVHRSLLAVDVSTEGHDSVAAGCTATVVTGPERSNEKSAEEEEDLGDNVELF